MKNVSLKRFVIFFGFVLSSMVIGEELIDHRVAPGETLSEIVKRNFPGRRIYGNTGKVKQVINLNPEVRDENLIFPNQIIKLKVEADTNTPEPLETIVPSDHVASKVTDIEVVQRPLKNWSPSVSAFYGLKYISLSQKGALGDASINAVFYNYLKLETTLAREDWLARISFDTFRINYQDDTSTSRESFYNLDLTLARKHLVASLGMQQSPLLSSQTDTSGVSKQELIYLGLGLRNEFELRKVNLELSSELRYLLDSFVDNSPKKISNLSGYRATAQARLKVEILKKNDRQLFATWLNEIGYQEISQNIKWGDSSGKIKSKATDAISAIGLLVNF
jgi:hypothetical protein